MADDVVAQAGGQAPVVAGVLALRDGVLQLIGQRGQGHVSLHGVALLSRQVGGTPAQGLVAGQLHVARGQPRGQRVAGGQLGLVLLGLHAQHLEAAEAGHLIAVHGGQLGGGVVVAEQLLGSLGIPGAIHDGGHVGGVGDGGAVHEGGAAGQLDHALQGLQAVLGGIVHVAGGQVAFVVGIIGQGAARAKEERGLVPAGVDLHVEALAGGLAVGQDAFQGGGIGDDALVVVQEVAVVAGQRVGVQLVAHGDGGHGARVVLGLHDLGVGGLHDLHRAGGHHAGQLVLGEAKNVGSGVHVGDDLAGGVALAHGLNGNGHIGKLGVRGLEGLDLLVGEVHGGVGHPDLQVAAVALGQRGAAQGQHQRDGQHQGQDLLHTGFLLCSSGRGCGLIRHPPPIAQLL